MNFLRPLRLLIPFVAIAAALALFLGVGFIAFNIGGGGGGRPGTYGAVRRRAALAGRAARGRPRGHHHRRSER